MVLQYDPRADMFDEVTPKPSGSHIDAINEAASVVRMESDTMLRSEVRVLNELIVKHPDKTILARAMLDVVMREIERREALKGVAR